MQPDRIAEFRKLCSGYTHLLNFGQNKYFFEKMRMVNEFFKKTETLGIESSFIEIKATSGAHSVIIYNPKTSQFFCQNILVDVRIINEDIGPKVT